MLKRQVGLNVKEVFYKEQTKLIDGLIAAQPKLAFQQIENQVTDLLATIQNKDGLDLRFQKSASWFSEIDPDSTMSKYHLG